MSSPIGSRVPRKDGPGKVDGSAVYIDDMHLPDMLYGVTVRSPIPHGVIREIRFGGDDIPWDEITVVTAQDIPGDNVVTLLKNDQPFLADGVVHHREEAVLLLAHADHGMAERARQAVELIIDPLPAVLDMEAALTAPTCTKQATNIQHHIHLHKGDVDAAFSAAVAEGATIVEGVWETGAQEQLYIETQGMIATADADQVTVWGSIQCPYYVHKALVPLFNRPGEKIRVVQATTGGGFGGKEEYPSILAGHAALLALKSGRPVKMIYDRAEDMAVTTKRHPSRAKHRMAVAPDGKLLAMDIDFLIDGGAYVTLSPVVLSRGVIHAAGPYQCDNIRIRGNSVATNTPPHGAFRGFGAPQSIFAVERQMDRAATALGITPEAIRRRNLLRTGERTATQHLIEEPIDLRGLVDQAKAMMDWDARKAAHAVFNATPGETRRRGLGLSTFFHGSGFTGSGEVYLASEVDVSAGADGRIRVMAASTDIGQGTNTIFGQIVSEAIGVDYHDVDIAQPDTANVPDSGPTVASRTVMIVGKLVERASKRLKERLIAAGFMAQGDDIASFNAACARHHAEIGPLIERTKYTPPPGVEWDDSTYTGAAYGTYGWATYMAEVEVDTVTWEAHCLDFVALQDVGTVLHPVLAEGQVEGGVAQGIGWALSEDIVWQNGRMANGQMTNYIMPTMMDLPEIRVAFAPVPYAHGPSGAKGIGELPMDGPAPAIAQAIEDAVGVPVHRIPATPERLMDAFNAQNAANAEGGER